MDEQSLFTAALERSPAERSAYLDEACGGDAPLRKRLDLLLRLHENAGDFLEHPAAALTPCEPASPIAERPGQSIGRYKLLEEIGEGGMGVVYRAEQQEPVRRLVALKIVKAGMDTRRIIARFEAERQTLALMDHPNIVRVLDAGTTGEKDEGGRIKDEGGRMKDESAATADIDSSFLLHPSPPLVRSS